MSVSNKSTVHQGTTLLYLLQAVLSAYWPARTSWPACLTWVTCFTGTSTSSWCGTMVRQFFLILFICFLTFIYFTSLREQDKVYIDSSRWSKLVGLELAYICVWAACSTTVLYRHRQGNLKQLKHFFLPFHISSFLCGFFHIIFDRLYQQMHDAGGLPRTSLTVRKAPIH